MRRMLPCFALFVVALIALPLRGDTPPAGSYTLDGAHTTIGFKVKHLGITEVFGRFNEFDGRVHIGDEPAFEATIQIASIDTGVEARDQHLRTDDFFDAENHPEMTFRSTSAEWRDGVFHVTGELTFLGRTNEVELPLSYQGSAEFQGRKRIGLSGETTIDRREWGMTGFPGLVGDDITLMIAIQAIAD
jgi:polyisoprenoid-binding protein YceI